MTETGDYEPISVDGDATAEPVPSAADAESLRRERDQYLAMAKEARAEFENYQKRSAREREVERRYWNADLARSILPAIDNLDRALDAARQSGDEGPLVQGVSGTVKQLLDSLARHGIARVDVKPGDPLDPHRHEAVMQQASDQPEGTVAAVFHAGYLIHDRVLRPAGVSVSKGQA